MIRGLHAMFYSAEAEALRVFIRDKLKFSFSDVGEGWLIFNLPEADLGCHPADPDQEAPSGTPDISFYCDDLEKTVAELKARGVEFTDPIADHGYGLVTYFKMPGLNKVQLFQPRYVKNTAPPKSAAKPKRANKGQKAKKPKRTAAQGRKKPPRRR